MDFRNKYLKYKPEITFDIFQDVWDKLIESGYLPVGKYDVEKGFRDFKTLHCYLRTTENHPMAFNCYSVIPALFWVETTVQEILGYDPFVKDNDFVLPKKWCCKITEESIEIFNNWRISMSKHYLQKKIDKKYPYITNDGSCNYTTWGKEITFDQFKKYVLKQCVEKGKEVIPEYVECISWFGNSFTPSKIYKVVNGKVKDNDGYHKITDWNHVDFKPSSKSAFDLQNQPKQPLKQAVHCETQEQWDFVVEKVGYNNLSEYVFNKDKSESCVILNSKNHMGSLKWATKENYQILSFSDWCAQNNYEFQSKATSLKNMFYFNVSEQTANNISETIDIAIQTAKVGMLKDALKSFTCEIQHDDHEFLAQMLGGKVSKVNKVQISTDNEIKINIIQKQSIKI